MSRHRGISIKKLLTLALVAILSLTPATNANAASVSSATLLKALKVVVETNGSTYNRDLFKHWTDADSDGCDTRAEVLQQESKVKVGCDLIGGKWLSTYDGVATTLPSSFDVDHMVPLKEAWESGASLWDDATREAFANDLGYATSLIAVTASSNRSKGDKDPAGWLPRKSTYVCTYVAGWVAVKYRWSLTVDKAEKAKISTILSKCGSTGKVLKPAVMKIINGSVSGQVPSASPTGEAPSAGPTALDPQFASCAEAVRNGYTKPYVKGVNPEYAWYQDRDGDGIVCE